MAELIDNGRTDIAMGPRPTSTEAHVEVFGQEEVVVVAAAGHRFAQIAGVSVAEIASEQFVHYDPDNGMAVWVDQLAADQGVVLDPVLRTRSPRTAAQLAAAGMGVTIVPVSAWAPRPTGVVRRLRPRGQARRDRCGGRTFGHARAAVCGRHSASRHTPLGGTNAIASGAESLDGAGLIGTVRPQ
jgi:DNA-binding transcriptional LysR family regulator